MLSGICMRHMNAVYQRYQNLSRSGKVRKIALISVFSELSFRNTDFDLDDSGFALIIQ